MLDGGMVDPKLTEELMWVGEWRHLYLHLTEVFRSFFV